MTAHSLDTAYAWVKLGLDTGASADHVEEVVANARAYRFATRARIDQMRRLAEFFIVRATFGPIEASFAEIRKAYHKQALALHPDLNHSNREAEEQLKLVNAAFALVDEIHREARDYFRQNEAWRRETEKEAREAAGRERPVHAKRKPRDKPEAGKPRGTAESGGGGRRQFMAASVPRFIRNARLSHLPRNAIIGCWYIPQENDLNYVFDIIMLPEREFLRARNYLGAAGMVSAVFESGWLTPPYIPKDVRTVIVPPNESDPHAWAKKYFLKEFGLEKA